MPRYTKKIKNRNNKTRKNHSIGPNKVQNKNTNYLIIGLIYADWCGHCQALKPQWEEMKNVIKGHKGNYRIVEIEDSDFDKDNKIIEINKNVLDEKLAANGYPTIFKKQNNKIFYYGGEREPKTMADWFLGNKIMGGYQMRKKNKK
jgi:thiol-disulfide isomerase/thioredoxin